MSEIVSKEVEKKGRKTPAKKKKRKLPKNVIEKDGIWYVRRAYKSGMKTKQTWRVCHEKTSAAAAEILAEIDEDLAKAKAGRLKRLSKFSDIAEKFKTTELVEAVFIKEKKVSGKIQLQMPLHFVKNLTAHFGAFPISEITLADLKDYKQKRIKTKVVKFINKKTPLTEKEKAALPSSSRQKFKIVKTKQESQRSIRSVNYEMSVLRQIFNFAIQNKWIRENPFDGEKRLIDTAQENKRNVTWTKDEEKAALSLCSGIYAHMKPVIILIVDGGFRKNELLSAHWKDVDFENEFMLAKSYKGNNLLVRYIYFTKRMKEALIEWKRLQKKVDEIQDKSLVIGYKDVKKSWQTLRKSIGREDLHIHDLRHVYATRLSENVPLAEISKLLGHSNLKTTQIYINPQDPRLRAAIKTLEDE